MSTTEQPMHTALPSSNELLEFFEIEPTERRPEDGYVEFDVHAPDGTHLTFSVDAFERSVQTTISLRGAVVARVCHEGAISCVLDRDTLRASFDAKDFRTTLVLQLRPQISVSWASLAVFS